jgi:hypothetical protein
LIAAANGVLEQDRKIMESVQIGRSDGHFRVQFAVVATNMQHQQMLKRLREMPNADHVECLGVTDHE